MVRKMAYIGSSYLIGLFFASFFGCSLNIMLSVAAVTAAVFALILNKGKNAALPICVISAAAGMLLYGLYDLFVYRNIIKYDGCPIEINGVITEYTEHNGDKASYTIKGVINDGVKAYVTCYTDSAEAEAGDFVSISGTAAVFEDSYTFPARSYYKAKGIFLQIKSAEDFSCTPDTGFSPRRILNRYRERIVKTIGSIMDEDGSAVMSAMLFGDKSDIESSQKTLMYRAGIGHIMAVSGVHLSVVCSLFGFFISRLPINKFFRFGLLLVPIFCFVLLAGMSNSVLRAAVMILLVNGADLFRRRQDTFNSLGIAVILLTVTAPFAVRDASFLLSAGGVFGIGVAAPEVIRLIERKYKLGAAARSVIASFCVTVLLFPISMLFFDEVSMASPISNLLLLPICELIMIGGIIVTLTGGAMPIAVPVLKICGVLCDAVLAVSKFIGGLHFSYVPLGGDFAKTAAAVSAAAIAVIFAATRKADKAVLSAVTVLFLAILSINAYRLIPDGNITAAVLKDGNAVTVVVHDKKSAGVIDLNKGGGAASSAVKYLNQCGIRRLDALILNSGANTSLPVYKNALELFDVGGVFIPERDKAFAYGDSTLYENCSRLSLPKYNVSFIDSDVVISCGETRIVFYPADFSGSENAEYSAAVRYSGKNGDDANAKIIAVMNDNANAAAESGRIVYIGESVKFTISSDGTVRSEVIR